METITREYDFSVKPNFLLNMPRAFRDDLSTEASVSYTLTNMRYGEISRSDDHYVTAINRWGWYPAEKMTFRSGVDWRFSHVDSTMGDIPLLKLPDSANVHVC
jgi:hypothetical protein